MTTTTTTTILVGDDGHEGGRDAVTLAEVLAGADGAMVPTTIADGESVGKGLHSAAEAAGADLIVIGSCRRGAVGRLFAGDDTARTLRDAPCPVAVAPRGYTAPDGPIATIGVGYDGGDASIGALAFARTLAERSDAEIRVLDVAVLPTYPMYPPYPIISPGLYDDGLKQAEALIAGLEGVEGSATDGYALADLARLAAEVDILVVGTRDRGRLDRLLEPSVAAALARAVPSPLVVVPEAPVPAASAGVPATAP